MKFSIKKSKFIEALNVVSRAIAPIPVFDILKGIKIEIFNNYIILKASDSLISIEYVIDKYIDDKEMFSTDSEGEIVVPSKYFIDIIKKAPTEYIEFDANSNSIKISSGNSEFNIQGYEVNEYPDFPIISKENKFTISANLFNNIIKETIFCTAQNDQRPILEGVNLELFNSILTATATDSHRLSKRKISLENINTEQTFNMIIPRKALQSVQKIIENRENDIDIYYEDNRIVFVYENITYIILLISGKYPNTDKLIPNIKVCEVEVSGNILFEAVDRVSLISRDDKNDIVKLSINSDTINIFSQSKELGNAEEEIYANIKNDEDLFEIAVSAKFLKEAIHAINSETIIIKFSGELTAFTIEPSDYHRDIVQVLLPVRTY
ncbi:DNA polymerase III subunit beta [Gemelliphila palaticanis]|uniref:Beta sliding clamp n=1 Tax=Gemelliphila palaticanis TaxID=81950 RepID=A0ABX2T2Z9_9BACL|nr:DNA polymerase III subunit beta [Gemella palaticanis]MBF0715919.1 DNA polymerase III subunit beta [Gemella palaticanis]NYS47849.1 DNA polymerase III subunit beta [Gemella palaticanis]